MGSARLDGEAFGRRSLEYDYLQLRDENVHLKKHAREQEEKAKKLATRLSRVINEKIKQGATTSELGPRRQMVEMEGKVEDLDNKVRILEKQNMQLKGKLQVSRQLIATATQFQGPYSRVQPRVNSGLRRPIQKPRPFGNESSATGVSLQKKMGASDLVHAPPYVVSLIKEAKEEIEKLEAVVESQRLQLAEVAEQARFREAELQTELSEMKEQVNQGQVRYIQGNVDILSLRRDAEHYALRESTFKSELEALDKKMERVSAHNNSLLGEVDQLTSQLRTEQANNLQLEEKLSACEAMQKTIAELEQRLADLQQENEILKTANEQLLNSLEGSDADENKSHEEAGALKLQITQLEAIIKSDNDEKAVLEKELAERIELYRSLQEEHGNLEKAHAEVTARLENVEKDLQDLQKETHSKSLSTDRIIQPESSENDLRALLINGFRPSGPANTKQCFDKGVQATLLENGYEEMTKLKEEQQLLIEKERLRIEELQSLLTEKSKKIEVLEKNLARIPTKQVQVTDVCAPNEADDEHCLSLVRKGQSFLEIHLNKITFVALQDAFEGSAPPPVFATWTFADFQSQSTPVATGKCPEFNCTARYAVAVDPIFIDYLHKDSVQIEVQAVHGTDIHSLGTCQIALRPALQHPFKCNYAQAALVGVQDEQHKRFVGTLSYWVRFLPAADPARRLLGLSVPMSPPKELPHSGHQSRKQNGETANAMYNELKVNIIRCMGISSKQGHLRRSLYCCYQLCDFPEKQTGLSTPVANSVDFHHICTFAIKTDSQLHKQLLSQSLVLLLFEEDTEPGSLLGKASVPLSPLARGQAVQGSFLLFSPWGEDAGSVELEITWEHEYNPPRKPVPRARSRNELGVHKSKRMPSAQHRASASWLLQTTRDMTKDQQNALRPQEPVINKRKNILSSHSRKGSRERGEHAESSSLTSVSSLSPASGSNSTPAGVKANKVQRQEDGRSASGVNNNLAEESQSLEEFSNGQVVVVKTAALKRSDTFKISDAAVFSVINLGFLPGAAVLKNKSVEMLFVEFQFLNCSPEELETPVALPKPKPPQRIAFNFRKVVHLDANRHQERREALASMMSSKNPNSAIIKFTVVSEPIGKNKDAECQDVGIAIVDLKQIVKYGKDIIEEDVDVLDTRNNKVIGKLNVSIEILAALKRILAESKHTSHMSS
ncbi:protein fantom-like isoform X2 [Dermacentor andersoni]|uniref:protein fantom-like isoform X2 n=1 Tax=Dermacentor andersoni TaxID=34620 RepID=UPI002415A2C2|nr:protein fantom-like isoform X2 [Dermacentor andersoni]